MKELVCLCKTPFIAGDEADVLVESAKFAEADISEVYIDDPWWGVLDLVVEAYVAVTYAAYTAAAPPAWGQIMFNADRTHFKCGTGLWWGKVMGYVIPVGSRVLVS